MRRTRKYPSRRRIPRSINNKIYQIVRTQEFASFIAPPLAFTGFIYQPSLSNVDEFANMAVLWDSYRIKKLKFIFTPYMTNSTTPITAINQVFYSVIDFNDAQAPSSISYLTQYQNCRRTNSTRNHIRSFAPSVPTVVNTSNNINYTVQRTSPWLSTNIYPGPPITNGTIIEHGILKIGIQNTGTAQLAWAVSVQFTLQFRQVN